jgi:penicillin-binding protein 2
MATRGYDKPVWPARGLLVIIGVFFLLILGRLFYLQILRGDYYRSLSTSNHIRIVGRPAPRGLIVDRNGEMLADNYPAFTVALIYSEFDQRNSDLTAGLLGMHPDLFAEHLANAAERPYRPYTIIDGLSVDEASPVADNLYRIGGLILDVVPKRRYHHSRAFCHITGYVGLSNEPGSHFGEVTGRAGLEMVLDGRLSGVPGTRREVVDALGRVVEEFEGTVETVPEPGENLRLTLDAGLQEMAIEVLEETGFPGAFAAIDYETGEILCLASVPCFDTNDFAGGISTELWDSILDDPGKPLLNRAWGAAYPPGSTFKVITTAYLLENDLIDRAYLPDPCYGVYTLGDTDFRCWSRHGRLEIVSALARSCDIYFYRTVQLGNMDDLAAFAGEFGLGSPPTGILQGELGGLVPDTEFMDSRWGPAGWGLGSLLNISIGQGELLTSPLQMAVVTGILSSGGEMPGLTLVSGDEPVTSWTVSLSSETFEIINEGMRRAVSDRDGTLYDAMSGSALEFFGKTGTAESPGEDHAWVIGYIREPVPVAFAVIVEHGGHGSTVAAPVAVRILEMWLGLGAEVSG